MGIHLFDREELLVRDIDQLDLGKAWRIFWGRLRAKAPGRLGWYRHSFRLIASWRLPLMLMLGVWVTALGIGYQQAGRFAFPSDMQTDLPAA